MFDVYGTLFISGSGDIGMARDHGGRRDLLETLLRRNRVNMSPEQMQAGFSAMVGILHQQMKNQGVDVPEVAYDRIWASLLPGLDPEAIHEFAVAYELIVNPVYPMPNLDVLLAGCRKRKLTMGIISNAQFFTPLLFQWFLGGAPESIGFDPGLLFYSYQYGVAKPSPVLFGAAVAALEERGVGAGEVLYIGNDMLNDIYAAQQDGFQTALFAGDARSLRLREDRKTCEAASPDLVLTDLSQLLDHV